MPRWLGRVLWSLRGRRLVRLHLADRVNEAQSPSVEGILVGRWGGHYVLLKPKMLAEKDRTYSLEGTVEVPADRVLFCQVIG